MLPVFIFDASPKLMDNQLKFYCQMARNENHFA